jgi:sugar phosphate isomerase/epimerase
LINRRLSLRSQLGAARPSSPTAFQLSGCSTTPDLLTANIRDYLGFIDVYHERIKAFHVKDAELRPSPKQGVYSGFADWPNRAGRFRSPGDGDIDFGATFSSLAVYDYDSWGGT